MTEKATEGNEDTFNAADLLKLLDEFMGRRAMLGGDTADIDSGQTIAAVGLFFVNVGWVLRLDQHRYIRLPADAASLEESLGLELRMTASNGGEEDGRRKSKRHRGDRRP